MNIKDIDILKEKSKNKRAFFYMLDGKWYVCDDLKNMPFKGITLEAYVKGLEDKNAKLEEEIKTLKDQQKQMAEAIRILNSK